MTNCVSATVVHQQCPHVFIYQGLLLCYQREGDEPVPGCTGEGAFSKDYCYDAGATLDTLMDMGNNGYPTGVFPLQRCQGDCDSDDDCAGNLVCFTRTLEAVPSCIGEGRFEFDYWYVDDESSKQSTLGSRNTNSSSITRLQIVKR